MAAGSSCAPCCSLSSGIDILECNWYSNLSQESEIDCTFRNECLNLPFHYDVSQWKSHVLQNSKKNGNGGEKQELVTGKFLLPTFPEQTTTRHCMTSILGAGPLQVSKNKLLPNKMELFRQASRAYLQSSLNIFKPLFLNPSAPFGSHTQHQNNGLWWSLGTKFCVSNTSVRFRIHRSWIDLNQKSCEWVLLCSSCWLVLPWCARQFPDHCAGHASF